MSVQTKDILLKRFTMLCERIEVLERAADRAPERRADALAEADQLGIELDAVRMELKRRKVAGY